MSFSGKKYRRVRCENIEEMLKAADASKHAARIINCAPPTFSFTRLDENTFTFTLQCNDKLMTHTFKLGEEHDMERRDGTKVKVTYILEGDNVLKQVIKQPDGKTAHFRREFGDTETKMTIALEGTDIEAYIYYEIVN